MKTIRQWLEELPEPYRSEALENTPHKRLGLFFPTKRDALMGAFDWFRVKQKAEYWISFYTSLL